MPVPATTGQKRTRVSDMQIGDYIACEYWQNTAGSPGSLSLLGTATRDEIPVTGMTAAPTSGNGGTFYFVKVDKGLLIGDRVVNHSIPWDTLNTGRLIQGLPWNNGNIIPIMTSHTTPTGNVIASSIYRTAWDGWRAFDGNNSTYWATQSGVLTGSLIYDFGSIKSVSAYSITIVDLNSNVPPINWTFEGWDESKSEWTVLDSKLEYNGWKSSGMKIIFPLQKTESYSKFRLNITKSSPGSNLGITELEMFEVVGSIRSLTGGVAYADANGNMSLTNQGKGAFPIINEWDKYIVNFPVDKIQSGKTLDDVFHYADNYSWVQETPLYGTWRDGAGSVGTGASASTRIVRGNTNRSVWMDINYNSTSYTTTTWGFRPVFEYKEV
ncbi:discoidin domain-containing protein [Brevibacillus brevis]|uniref:discoidin domain-containing protein n=1 Tax=Brevibacillus brevis TaxID=1393 RepID=UPI000D10B138|nr:discoidin domain-containing protein [Brevibacillus brevis]PSJ71176.1 hypothetical protein C7J99_01230 [Brevibacillus brevis]RED28778.1 hypothetical protein DES34_107128 [Brevibacillus brevis]GEC89782.1 hypothetical protein BBR01nite_21130 [Brevibacillus brevis]VEF91627.1 Uncharacterised protein [Brevibacillus brevis]